MAEKYDPEREAQARLWLEDVAATAFPSEDFQQSLKDGVILCKCVTSTLFQSLKCSRSIVHVIQSRKCSDPVGPNQNHVV
jgi:hypothetical protein